LCLAARTFGFNPAYTVQITETVHVKIEVVGSLSGSGSHDGELQKNGLEEHAPTQEPNGLDRESGFPVRVAKKKMYSGTALEDQYVRLSRVETPLWGALWRITHIKLSVNWNNVNRTTEQLRPSPTYNLGILRATALDPVHYVSFIDRVVPT
jgi:hypothetical protein